MHLSYTARLLLIALAVAAAGVLGLFGRHFFVPESFGRYGHYRAEAITEEAGLTARHGTNASCLSCHRYEARIHLSGRHATISCEFCHGAYADHAENGKKTGTLPVKKNEEIITLCLRCHNKAIQARPSMVIKTVTMPEHLKEQNVKLTHTCNQCHHVHAPLLYINMAKKMTGTLEASNAY